MCLWFACFRMHKTNDDGYCYATAPVPPPAAGVSTKPPHDGRPPQVAAQWNGYGHYHYQTAADADKPGRKASNDARRGPAATKYAPEKAFVYTGPAETVRQPA